MVSGVRFISSLTKESRVIAWSDPTVAILGFNVYRSRTNRFADSIQLNVTPVTVLFYEDPVLENVEDEIFYYWVAEVKLDSTVGEPVGPVWQPFEPLSHSPLYGAGPDKSSIPSIRRISDEIRRRHSIIQAADGEVIHYLSRVVAGPVAVDYDPYRRDAPYRGGLSNTGDAQGDYGTRFKGGYVLFPNVLIRFIPAQSAIKREDIGLVESKNPAMWVTDFPMLNPRDVIVRQNNERYVLTKTGSNALGGRVTRQTADLEFLDPQNIVYKFPVPPFGSISTPTQQYPFGNNGRPLDEFPKLGDKPALPDKSDI